MGAQGVAAREGATEVVQAVTPNKVSLRTRNPTPTPWSPAGPGRRRIICRSENPTQPRRKTGVGNGRIQRPPQFSMGRISIL